LSATKPKGKPSTTSVWPAAARALGAREPDPRMRNPDWLAERLIGPEELEMLGNSGVVTVWHQPYEEAIQNPETASAARVLLIRTRFIDQRLENAIHDGATQFVVLGAGFDSRAYRFGELLRNARVFEVDRPFSQEMKVRRVRQAIGEPPSYLSYVAVDFRVPQVETDSARKSIGVASSEPHPLPFRSTDGRGETRRWYLSLQIPAGRTNPLLGRGGRGGVARRAGVVYKEIFLNNRPRVFFLSPPIPKKGMRTPLCSNHIQTETLPRGFLAPFQGAFLFALSFPVVRAQTTREPPATFPARLRRAHQGLALPDVRPRGQWKTAQAWRLPMTLALQS